MHLILLQGNERVHSLPRLKMDRGTFKPFKPPMKSAVSSPSILVPSVDTKEENIALALFSASKIKTKKVEENLISFQAS
jgi:hypothetical protein